MVKYADLMIFIVIISQLIREDFKSAF